MSILVVDDSRSTHEKVKQFLTHMKEELISTYDGDQAIAFLQSDLGKQVDLIVMDIVMPGKSGIETCSIIKQDASLKEIPIMIMTASASEESICASFACGATDFIRKPLGEAELLARVNTLLSLKKERDKVRLREEELLDLGRQLELVNRELAQLVSLDGLTGIPNRRSFDEKLKSLLHSPSSLCLILADIDHFKQYNDEYGHLLGDECLKTVATAIKDSLKRPQDFACRYGGEEFAVLLPQIEAEKALQFAETLRRRIMFLKIPHHASLIDSVVTISLGMSYRPEHSMIHPQELLQRADTALYKAKDQGRNRAVLLHKPS